MSPILLLFIITLYFLVLLAVAWHTGKNADNNSFYIGNRNSNWMVVAFGMIGTSLSGVTFVSVPGDVGLNGFTYFQILLGYFIGYWVIALVLIPLYYKLQLTSIYHYLSSRYGIYSYKTGAAFFILSRTLGATARLYLVVNILQASVLENFGVPFWLTTLIILVMIYLYTFKGGVKTIVWTDTLQTTCMLAGLVFCMIYLMNLMDLNIADSLEAMQQNGFTKVFVTDPSSKSFFLKQILAGAFITITMTGLDQEMMQKTISVKNRWDSQKNMITLSFIMLFVIFLFLYLGGLLYLFAGQQQLSILGDQLFPVVALQYLPPFMGIIFIIALVSALFPSADGAITALTSSFCIDILGINERKNNSELHNKRTRQIVHIAFGVIFLLFVLLFKWISNPSMINVILKIAGYTYGPLLGLFAFGILTSRKVKDRAVPLLALLAPLLCLLIDSFQEELFGSFEIGLELLIINGLLMFTGLWFISGPVTAVNKYQLKD